MQRYTEKLKKECDNAGERGLAGIFFAKRL